MVLEDVLWNDLFDNDWFGWYLLFHDLGHLHDLLHNSFNIFNFSHYLFDNNEDFMLLTWASLAR